MHLHNFNQLNPRYFVRRLDYFEVEELFCVHFDDEAFTLDCGTQIEFPFNNSRANICFRIVGCCNGVVCLCDEDYSTSSLDTVILWNPSIRRKLSLTLPKFNSTEFEESYVVLGFGYDKISDDYKVVRLTYAQPSSIRPQASVALLLHFLFSPIFIFEINSYNLYHLLLYYLRLRFTQSKLAFGGKSCFLIICVAFTSITTIHKYFPMDLCIG